MPPPGQAAPMSGAAPAHDVTDVMTDSPYAAFRLGITLVIMTIGSAGMYVLAVMLPAVQAEFGIARGAASLPYTLLMIGFGVGGVLMGRLADRHGVMVPLLIGGVSLGIGFVLAGMAGSIWTFMLVNGVFIGLFGCSASLAPLITDTSQWFVRRRGIAVAICASGNYLPGLIWPPIVQQGIESVGWRTTYFWLAGFSIVTLCALALLMRRRPPASSTSNPMTAGGLRLSDRPFGLSPGRAQALLCTAGVACCVAMAMPQVHIVAYCGDLGFGTARGAQILSLMLGAGIVSRLVFGIICDRIGGMRTLLLGSVLQGVALLMFLPADTLLSLTVVATLFGLFQGGIVPAYAIIVREYFAPREAGARVGTVIMSTLVGMALGGWMSGAVFDLTGSYRAAFFNGIGWNLVNLAIATFLLRRAMRAGRQAG